jgi:membrane-associated phospholipid phosphatase
VPGPSGTPQPYDQRLATSTQPSTRPRWTDELLRIDTAVYAAIAATPTPSLDRAFRRLSRAADHSKVWLGTSAVLAVAAGPRGRRAALNGIISVAATSAIVNALMKPLGRRRRPERAMYRVPLERQVKMPRTRSFPSGHAASATAYASGVAIALPEVGIGVTVAAGLVAYSRVHTGVHYPIDVIAGSLTGAAVAPAAVAVLDHRMRTSYPGGLADGQRRRRCASQYIRQKAEGGRVRERLSARRHHGQTN